jgi:hypothetical protein
LTQNEGWEPEAPLLLPQVLDIAISFQDFFLARKKKRFEKKNRRKKNLPNKKKNDGKKQPGIINRMVRTRSSRTIKVKACHSLN